MVTLGERVDTVDQDRRRTTERDALSFLLGGYIAKVYGWQMAFFLAIDDIARSVQGRVSEYLYDREEFIGALRRVESHLERELPEPALKRLQAAR